MLEEIAPTHLRHRHRPSVEDSWAERLYGDTLPPSNRIRNPSPATGWPHGQSKQSAVSICQAGAAGVCTTGCDFPLPSLSPPEIPARFRVPLLPGASHPPPCAALSTRCYGGEDLRHHRRCHAPTRATNMHLAGRRASSPAITPMGRLGVVKSSCPSTSNKQMVRHDTTRRHDTGDTGRHDGHTLPPPANLLTVSSPGVPTQT